MSNADFMRNLRPTRIEFRDPVFIGFGPYAAQIYLQAPQGLPPTSPVAASYSMDHNGWWLVLQSGITVLIPHANVRFVVYEKLLDAIKATAAIGSDSSSAQVHGKEQPESVGSDGQAESGAEPSLAQEVVDDGEKVHEPESSENEPQPKKRGRPPKSWSLT